MEVKGLRKIKTSLQELDIEVHVYLLKFLPKISKTRR